ncbi:MAG: MaoC/PaaZ C-terminal domain-containing protein [Gemmatimonadota bacterium]|nr:MaoC/PaaZ C-terminal domain-containing protein [Gemmatimonadota bacterium]
MTERQFSHEDQLSFAELSGDFNPVHVDPIAARRSLFGRPVVHGVHQLLWALNSWLADKSDPVRLDSLKCEFRGALRTDTTAVLQLDEVADGTVAIEIGGESGETVLRLSAVVVSQARPDGGGLDGGRTATRSPRVLSVDEIAAANGILDLYLDPELAGRLFPNAMRVLPPLQMAELLATTRLVGMECPGLQSIYSQLDLKFAVAAGESRSLSYEVANFDERYSALDIAVHGPGARGTVRAFLRPTPQEQVRFEEIDGVVSAEFAEQRALIVGGSRGLGEVAAKLLAAGGAQVTITFFSGEADAKLVVDDIVAGGGRCDSVALDVLDPKLSAADLVGARSPSHLYYFATPSIFTAVKGIFAPQLFRRFCDYYVDGFVNTVNLIQEHGSRLEKVLYPSTVALDELPSGMGEYAAAKAAGETLCRFLEETQHGLTIVRPRLPRLATDQTRSLLPIRNEDPVQVLLRELRRCRDA